ncbi:MAG TPA: Crp/Fnr family transcriptional regulator [Chitinophaga sp.]|uniref:Crp/Fnr family transcriptional regulator n=1 Tax=Chitinophaga sp. TaxID=1869181 RepID=UPI002F94D61E
MHVSSHQARERQLIIKPFVPLSMTGHFETFITAEVSLTKEELKLLCSLATEKKLRRRQQLLHEGEVCRFKAFVVKGLLRTYCTRDDGAEYNMRFAVENGWMLDTESYNSQLPSKYNIEALEDTQVLLWSRENMDKIFEAIPAFRSYSDKLKTSSHDANLNRILMNISYTAEEKYQEFVNSFPDVFRRIPLHMVASYLGVSRETLSRIRHAQLKRQKEF